MNTIDNILETIAALLLAAMVAFLAWSAIAIAISKIVGNG